MKQCPKCQANIKDTAKFCMICGCNIKEFEAQSVKPQVRYCSECGTEIPVGSFCPECGHNIDNDNAGSSVLDDLRTAEQESKQALEKLQKELEEADRKAKKEQAELDAQKAAQNRIQRAKEAKLAEAKKNLENTYRREGDTVYFGMYPQSLKKANVIVYEQTNEHGWFKASDGAWYAYAKGTDKYYKVEPIQWRVLYENDNEIKLVSEYILGSINIWNSRNSKYPVKTAISDALDSFCRTALNDLTKLAYFDCKRIRTGCIVKWNKDLPQCGDVGLLSAQQLEYIPKKEQQRKPTDFASKAAESEIWLLKDAMKADCYYKYRSTLFGAKIEAVDKNCQYSFGFVPCIKLNKKAMSRELELSDVDYMVSYEIFRNIGSRYKINKILIAPGDSLMQRDVAFEYDYYAAPYEPASYNRKNAKFDASTQCTVIDVFIKEGDNIEPSWHYDAVAYSYL